MHRDFLHQRILSNFKRLRGSSPPRELEGLDVDERDRLRMVLLGRRPSILSSTVIFLARVLDVDVSELTKTPPEQSCT